MHDESRENSHLGRARWRATGARGGGQAARGRRREVVGGGGPHEARRGLRCHGGGLMRRGRRIGGGTRKKRKGGGVRRGRRGGDRSAPGTGGYIPGRFTPGASHQPGVKVLYSRCVLPTGSKGPFTPGAYYQPGVKVYLSSRMVTRTGSKGFFLAGHETAAHLYSRVGFPPGSKGGLQFRFSPVLSNSLVKYNRNAIVFVKYIVN